MPKITKGLSILISLLLCFESQGIWFEASGQAVIERGNKQLARQHATQEAIKQALLFAGASVKSVQQMANGLLEEDRFEIRAGGEVNQIELITEIYSGDVVTVSIRADIFPQDKTCEASDYQKTLVTTWYPIKSRHQASVGGIYGFGSAIADKLEHEFEAFAQHAKVKKVEPYYLYTESDSSPQQITELARKANSQYVLMGSIKELSLDMPKSAGLAFWRDTTPSRNFGLNLTLFDGHTGAELMDQSFATSALWEFDLHQSVDPHSQALWNSMFGKAISQLLRDVTQDIDEELSCLPAYGRILDVKNEQLQVNLGTHEGVELGDILTLYQLHQFYDPQGNLHFGYKLHPVKVKINQVFPNSAMAQVVDGSFLANIQPNDFVARH